LIATYRFAAFSEANSTTADPYSHRNGRSRNRASLLLTIALASALSGSGYALGGIKICGRRVL